MTSDARNEMGSRSPAGAASRLGRTPRLLVASAAVAALALAVLGAPAAFACSKEEGHHCYSVTYYEMSSAKGEKVFGASSNMELYYGVTPWWEAGDRQNAEMWVGLGNDRWVEGGATVGHGYNAGTGAESTPMYFVARNYGPGSYWEFDWQGDGPGYYNWYRLYIAEQGTANGTWCTQWAWDSKPDFCFADFAPSSTELEAGLEYATSPASGARINGRSVGAEEWTNWTWHESWSGSYNHAQPFYESPLCINVPAPGYTWGSVAFSAPGC